MCRTCGCDADEHEQEHEHPHPAGRLAPPALTPMPSRVVRLEVDLLDKNDRLARESRALFARRHIVALNVMGAPGAGKTALLEASLRRLDGEVPVAVLEGDQATDRDAERIRATGCSVVQVNTGAGCHLDAAMVTRSLDALALPPGSLLVIENVGNLVCPALFDLGERTKIVVMSVTEGDDKPLKYPHMFRAADVLVLNKVDLLPYVAFDPRACLENARAVNPRLRTFELSATTGEGVEAWCAWLTSTLASEAALT